MGEGKATLKTAFLILAALAIAVLAGDVVCQDSKETTAPDDPWSKAKKIALEKSSKPKEEVVDTFVPPSLTRPPHTAFIPYTDQKKTVGKYALHVNLFWYALFLLGILGWILLWTWLNDDAEMVGANAKLWSTGVATLGFGGIMLTSLVWAPFILLIIPTAVGVGLLYVQDRNRRVPVAQRILTQESIENWVKGRLGNLKFASKLGLGGPPAQARKELVVTLVRKDGTSINAIADRRESFSEALYASSEIIENAINTRVTDIHFEPKGMELRIRYRIDGMLHAVPPYPIETGRQIINCLKVLSDMDIAERRRSQDGSLSAIMPDNRIEIRAATSVSVHGETMSLRLLDPEGGVFRHGIEGLGFDPTSLSRLRDIIDRPNGMLLVSGPTGSGKTTTLYAGLSEVDSNTRKVITIEDPVEYQLPNITQTPINTAAGVTFASSLRAILRQAPDVIMVGEIRDAETAQIALQAANTGHLVLSTVHANDAVTTIYRLLDLGVETSLLQSGLTAVLAQRLVRVLCPACREPYQPPPELVEQLKIPPAQATSWYSSKGCAQCAGIGFRGRVGIYEILVVTEEIRDLLVSKPSLTDLKQAIERTGFRTLRQCGIMKVVDGTTSLREVQRVTK
ncbi:MAG TPA: GspE/PulE family protein [Candidatus Brocadiia bacterium]|nr:GspE/PulE family protein [Candidatus Brocadiia bacterium]